MSNDFIKVKGRNFYFNDKKIMLFGYGIGSWLNLEHFMIGLPGTDSQIRSAFINAYGKENAVKFWRKFYKSFINEDDFNFFKRIGINTLRIPFNYRLFEDDQNPYFYKKEGFKEVDRILKLCEKYELFIVLDLHAAPGGQNPDWHSDNAIGVNLFWEYSDFRKRTISLWKYIAKKYVSNKWIAGYDLLNEPVLWNQDRKLFNQFYTELISEIRKIDKNHILFVEGNLYGTDFKIFEPFEDPDVALSFHYYPFMRQSLSKKKSQKERILETLKNDVPLEYMTEKLNRPIWCGETGALFNYGNRTQHESMLKDILKIYKEFGISWSVWTYKDACSMGTVHPKEDSDWIVFSDNVKQKWNFWDEFNSRDKIVEDLINKYQVNISEFEKYKIGFRILANNQFVLKEKYNNLFIDIPFDSLINYVDSFKFDNCEIWKEVVDIVVNYSNQTNK